jgi:hypothetical protein
MATCSAMHTRRQALRRQRAEAPTKRGRPQCAVPYRSCSTAQLATAAPTPRRQAGGLSRPEVHRAAACAAAEIGHSSKAIRLGAVPVAGRSSGADGAGMCRGTPRGQCPQLKRPPHAAGPAAGGCGWEHLACKRAAPQARRLLAGARAVQPAAAGSNGVGPAAGGPGCTRACLDKKRPEGFPMMGPLPACETGWAGTRMTSRRAAKQRAPQQWPRLVRRRSGSGHGAPQASLSPTARLPSGRGWSLPLNGWRPRCTSWGAAQARIPLLDIMPTQKSASSLPPYSCIHPTCPTPSPTSPPLPGRRLRPRLAGRALLRPCWPRRRSWAHTPS